MDHAASVEVDPKQLAHAEMLWDNFVFWTKICIALIAAGLGLMGLFLI